MEFHPEIERLLTVAPPGIEPAFWEAISVGQRLRLLKRLHYVVSLTADQRSAIGSLPYWVAYGREDGLPVEWVSPDGLLLPKFRPGGGAFQLFKVWRRENRYHRLVRQHTDERLGSLARRYQSEIATAGLVTTWLTFHILQKANVQHPFLWLTGCILFLGAGAAALPIAGKALYTRCTWKKVRQRLGTA